MFINKTNIKLLAAALLTALAAPSCMNLDETREGGYGYLTISGLDLDVQVEQLVPTKAESVTLKSLGIDAAPDLSEIVFTLERHNSNPGTKSSEEDTVQPNVELPLEAGTYTLRVKYNGNNGADGFGEALFQEERSYPVTITPGVRTQLEVSLPLINSLIAVSVKDDLREDFTPSENYPITISYGNQTVTVEENVYHFVPAASEVTVTVTGTTAGVSKELEHEFITPSAAKFADVKFGKSTTEIPSITMGDVSEGAFEGGLYFSPAELTNISSDHTVVYKYQLEGDSDWTTATEISEVNGYKYLSGLTDGKKYFIKACVGNIESDPVEFSPKSLESCITVAAATGYPQHYTENNELAGTKMQASVKVKLPSIVASLAAISVESGNFKKGNAQLGTFKLDENNTLTNDTAKTIDVSNSVDWPYFPKGDGYVLDATIKCVLPNRTIESGPVYSTATITSPVPSFNVTVSAETSYSRYLNYKDGVFGYSLDLANTAGSGDDIMNISAKVGISNGILNNSNYTELYSVTSFKVDETALTNTSSAVGTLTAANLDGQSWAKHIVSASFKFDGIEKSGSKDCHVTGLPYIASPPTNGGDYKWESNFEVLLNTVEWNDDGVRLEGISKKAMIISPSFHVPGNINTTLTVTTRMRTMSVMHVYAQSHLICRISGTEVINRYGTKGSKDWSGGSDNVEEYTGIGTGILTSSNGTIEVENEYNKTEAYVYVYSVKLNYR